MSPKICKCHGVPMYRGNGGYVCWVNKRITDRRRQQTYAQTAKGAAVIATNNRRRIYISQDYRGRMKTGEQATRVNAYIKDRLHEFKSRYAAGPQMESGPDGTVASEATARHD